MSNGLTLPLDENFANDTDFAFSITVNPSSSSKGNDAVHGACNGVGSGVSGFSGNGNGVSGSGANFCGVSGVSNIIDAPPGQVSGPIAKPPQVQGAGVGGLGSKFGVWGKSDAGVGVFGTSTSSDAVKGVSQSSQNAGVSGQGVKFGVAGSSDDGVGVFGASTHGQAALFQGAVEVNGGLTADQGLDVKGAFTAEQVATFNGAVNVNETTLTVVNVTGECIQARCSSPSPAISVNNGGAGPAISATTRSGLVAGHFDGNVECTGDHHVAGSLNVDGDHHVAGTITVVKDIQLTGAADFAEEFDLTGTADAEPGTVMVLDDEGSVKPSCVAYDRKVAGVISGGGEYKPGIVLDKRASQRPRKALALVGKVYCKVDAQYAPVGVGDLLTTSPTPGHAMRAADPLEAFGAVIGKALRPLTSGTALVPILVALQ
jgi:hypothetical protein